MGSRYRGSKGEVRALDAYVKLVRCAAAVHGRLEESLRPLGLTENQFGLLEMLLHLGPLEPVTIGGKLFTSRPNVSLLVDQLEERGWVARQRVAGDRRRVLVALTPAGRVHATRCFAHHLQSIVAEFSALQPREQEELGRLCKQLGKRDS